MYRPSLGILESAATIRKKGRFRRPFRVSLSLTTCVLSSSLLRLV